MLQPRMHEFIGWYAALNLIHRKQGREDLHSPLVPAATCWDTTTKRPPRSADPARDNPTATRKLDCTSNVDVRNAMKQTRPMQTSSVMTCGLSRAQLVWRGETLAKGGKGGEEGADQPFHLVRVLQIRKARTVIGAVSCCAGFRIRKMRCALVNALGQLGGRQRVKEV
jgi:hypothetical protein